MHRVKSSRRPKNSDTDATVQNALQPFESSEPFESFEQFEPLTPSEPSITKTPPEPASTQKSLFQKLLQRAIMYQAQREHTERELIQKLQRYSAGLTETGGNPPALNQVIEQVIQRLQTENWQSDARTAEQICHHHSSRHGTNRIAHTMAQKGISREIIADQILALSETELERAYQVWQRKFNALPTDAKEYAKQTRFLAYRGFTYDIITTLLKGRYSPET